MVYMHCCHNPKNLQRNLEKSLLTPPNNWHSIPFFMSSSSHILGAVIHHSKRRGNYITYLQLEPTAHIYLVPALTVGCAHLWPSSHPRWYLLLRNCVQLILLLLKRTAYAVENSEFAVLLLLSAENRPRSVFLKCTTSISMQCHLLQRRYQLHVLYTDFTVLWREFTRMGLARYMPVTSTRSPGRTTSTRSS